MKTKPHDIEIVIKPCNGALKESSYTIFWETITEFDDALETCYQIALERTFRGTNESGQEQEKKK